MTFPLRFLRKIAGTIRGRSVLLAEKLGMGSQAASTEPETEMQALERSGLFDERFYREVNLEVGTSGTSPLEHYLKVGGFQGRRPNGLFDSAYYLSTYPDVAEAGVNPALHYFRYGAMEGRDPSADFDTSYYLEANPDVLASGMNPLVHFLRFGIRSPNFRRVCSIERDRDRRSWEIIRLSSPKW